MDNIKVKLKVYSEVGDLSEYLETIMPTPFYFKIKNIKFILIKYFKSNN